MAVTSLGGQYWPCYFDLRVSSQAAELRNCVATHIPKFVLSVLTAADERKGVSTVQ